MSDSKVKQITDAIITAFNGKAITINSESVNITCEPQRYIRDIAGRYPFIEVSGPFAEVLERSSLTTHIRLNYILEFIDNRINDDYSSTTTILPISTVLGNVSADLQKTISEDITLGNIITQINWDDFGYYFQEVGPDNIEFVVYQAMSVETFVNTSNPYAG